MPARILAAVDPATFDPAPARFAEAIARATGAGLLVAGVYANDTAVNLLPGGQFGEELRDSASDLLEPLAADLLRDGVDTEALALAAASAPRAIDLATQELGIGLLVVGSSAKAVDGRVRLGSVSGRLVDGARSPVAVVPRGLERPPALRQIGVGFVDAAEGRTALRDAARLALRVGARLRVLTAVQPRAWMGAPADELETELRDLAAQHTQAESATVVGIPVDVDVMVAEPAAVLTDASAELDLLVCGARTYGARPAALLGGVTRRLVDEASCPVIVLARGPGGGLEALFDDREG